MEEKYPLYFVDEKDKQNKTLENLSYRSISLSIYVFISTYLVICMYMLCRGKSENQH